VSAMSPLEVRRLYEVKNASCSVLPLGTLMKSSKQAMDGQKIFRVVVEEAISKDEDVSLGVIVREGMECAVIQWLDAFPEGVLWAWEEEMV